MDNNTVFESKELSLVEYECKITKERGKPNISKTLIHEKFEIPDFNVCRFPLC